MEGNIGLGEKEIFDSYMEWEFDTYLENNFEAEIYKINIKNLYFLK